MMNENVMALIKKLVEDLKRGLITNDDCSNKILLLNHIYNGWECDDSKRT